MMVQLDDEDSEDSEEPEQLRLLGGKSVMFLEMLLRLQQLGS